jgi:hypothetical protein
MGKQSGLGDNFYIAEYNVSGDINSLNSISTPVGTLESTGIDKYAMERLYAHRDGHVEGTTYFNPAAGQAHEGFSSLPRTDRVVTYARGTTLGNPAFSMVAKQIDHNGTRADDGAFTFTFTADANNYGADWGRLLTAGVRTDTEATDGSPVDFGDGSTTFGLQAYLHVIAFTGTDATITIEESSDNGADSYAAVTGGVFTEVTGVTSERIQTARDLTVERYLRIATTTTGGFTNLQFVVVVNRNPLEVLY